MDKIIAYLSESYYTLLLDLCASVALGITGYIHRKKFTILKGFAIYGWASAIQLIAYCIFLGLRITPIRNLTVETLLIIEFAIIYRFLIQVIRYRYIKNAMIFIRAVMIFSIILFGISVSILQYHLFAPGDLHILEILEAIFIIIPCLIYIFDLLRSSRIIHIKEVPELWVIIGLLCFFGGTLPVFAFFRWIYQHNVNKLGLYAINFVAYAMMFAFIIRAYLCNPSKSNTITS